MDDLIHIFHDEIILHKNTHTWIFVRSKDLQGKGKGISPPPVFNSLESKRGNCQLSFRQNILPHCSRFCFEPRHAAQPGSFTIGTFLLPTAARFNARRQQAARPRIVNVRNDSTEWFIRRLSVNRLAFSPSRAKSRTNCYFSRELKVVEKGNSTIIQNYPVYFSNLWIVCFW